MKRSPDYYHYDANARLREWYASLLGQSMLEDLRGLLENALYATYGYHALQVGLHHEDMDFVSASELIHPVIQDETRWHGKVALVSDPTNLPVSARSLDLIILVHTLELSVDPYQVLRDVDRALGADGYLVIVGFNPRSLWGAWRSVLRWSKKVPWNMKFYSMSRVQDWLRLLGYRTLRRESVFITPPVKHGVVKRLRFLEHLHIALPYFGGVYMLKARKQTVPLTPIRMRWLPRRRFVGSGLPRPTSRST